MRLMIDGHECHVDEEDLPALCLVRIPWYVSQTNGRPFLERKVLQVRQMMHRYLMNPPDGHVVDHINRNSLDNRRANLRVCSQTENLRNRGIASHNQCGFKGVYFDKRGEAWRAQITANKVIHRLGSFATATEAALAYDRAAQQLHGDFASTNASLGLLTA